MPTDVLDLTLGVEASAASVFAGEAADFLVTVANLGTADAPGSVVVDLQVPQDTTYVGGDGWACDRDGSVATCERTGLDSGDTATIVVRAVPTTAGTATVAATVSVDGTEIDVTNNDGQDDVAVLTAAQSLPQTGFRGPWLPALGLVLVLAGAALIRSGRRQSTG